MRALRWLPGDEVAALAQGLVKTLSQRERFGALLALHVHVARAALREDRTDDAASAARAAASLRKAGYAPESMYLPETHGVVWRALTQAGAHTVAAVIWHAATPRILSRALPEVPAPFLHSFLNRDRVNRELLAQRAAGALPPWQTSATP